MDGARQETLQALFNRALSLPRPERAAFLDIACADDPSLRDVLFSLLAQHDDAADSPSWIGDRAVGRVAEETILPPEEGPSLPATVSHYQIEKRLGGGGMGVVYKGVDLNLNRAVALKFLPPQLSLNVEAKRRFVHEAKAASALDHPNIGTIYEIDETDDDRLFIAMAYYPGETLEPKIARGPFPVEEALDYALQVAEGLSRAHEAGIVHRDVKPANVIVTDRGLVKLIDFGLAKVQDVSLTQTGIKLGTAAYMSPEQARGDEVDHRTDLWSLGVLLYEMLTGKRPFRGEYELAVVYSLLNEHPAPVTGLRPEVPEALQRVVEKLLRKDPIERYPHAREVRDDLRAIKTGSATLAAQDEKSSIVVLPFENMSADAEQEYFCDGLAEDLINALTQLNNLRVVARTSAFAFKGRHEDVRQIGRKLGVATVLEGSVRKAGNRLRITVQLVDVADGYHLWSERFDRVMEDVFAIQDEISLTIADKLKVALLDTEKAALMKRHTANVNAYRLYLKGRYFWNRRTEHALKKAIRYFEEAIELDPHYALAHIGIADYYLMLGVWGFIPAVEANVRVQAAVSKALQLDDALADGYTSLGFWNALFNWDTAAAERAFRRALELNPQHTQARYWYGIHLTLVGRFEQAVSEMNRALELDPLSLPIHTFLGMALLYGRQFDDASDVFSRALEMDPKYAPAHFLVGLTHVSEAKHAEGISCLQKAVALMQDAPLMIGHLGWAYARAGRRDAALQMLDRLRTGSTHRHVSPYSTAVIHAGLGETDHALDDLGRAREVGEPFMVHARVTPVLDNLRSDPRFIELMSKVRARS